MPYLLFLKKQQNLKLSSAANYRWRLKGQLYVVAAFCVFFGVQKAGLQSVIVAFPGHTRLLAFHTCKHHILANLNYGLLNSVISDFEERSA